MLIGVVLDKFIISGLIENTTILLEIVSHSIRVWKHNLNPKVSSPKNSSAINSLLSKLRTRIQKYSFYSFQHETTKKYTHDFMMSMSRWFDNHKRKSIKLSKSSEELFEEFSNIKIHKGYDIIRFEFGNSNNPDIIIDKSSWITIYHSFNYLLDGAVGTLGRFQMYMNIEYKKKMIFRLLSFDRNTKYSMFFIKINNILWNNYKFIDDTCCSKDPNCETPCKFSFMFSLYEKMFEYSSTYIVANFSKYIKYDYYHIFESKNVILQKKMSILLKIMHEFASNKFYDIFELINLSLQPNTVSKNIIVRGKYGNLDMNVIVGSVCNGYTSNNCVNKCHAIKYFVSVKQVILNASMEPLIRKHVKYVLIKRLTSDKIKCRTDTCNRNGICLVYKINNDKLNGKKIKCKCKEGYRGKYCDNWYCNKNCNNNGICEGPNTCNCYHLYNGMKCDKHLIEKYLNPVKENCYHQNNSIKCSCKNDIVARKYCINILCFKINNFPPHENLKNIFNSSCECNKLFPEIQCCIYFSLK
ncbi:LOW QUALITY PROTEIN: hypothetical protein HZS_2228 [Henneguya salminicola]|nr:LOW QUALITY PROTEIN: hypothetical protein HZS_2228 [Henneguya salminicola]